MPICFDNIGDKTIIILSTSTRGWTKDEKEISTTCINQIQTDIKASGVTSHYLEVSTSKSLRKILSQYDPNHVVIFNWIEELDHLKHSYHIAPEIFEELGFIYTGTSAATLKENNDKCATKMLLEDNHVSTPLYTTLYKNGDYLKDWNTYPCIIKPSREHCSFGITRRSVVDNQKELLKRAQTLFNRFGQPLLVEEFIDGYELFVSVWGYDKIEILPPVCQNYAYTSDYHHHIYDYVAKWKRKTKIFHQCFNRLPADKLKNIPKSVYTQVAKAIAATKSYGYSRVDVRVRGNKAYIIDINPNPDITMESDFVIASSRLGFNYGQTILKLCDLACQNYALYTAKAFANSSTDRLIAATLIT